jgi:hypothetical protein
MHDRSKAGSSDLATAVTLTGVRALLMVVLGAVALNLTLVGLALIRYPAVAGAERIPWVLADIGLLLAYAALAGIVARRLAGGGTEAARRATWFGTLAGAIQAADITREYVLNVPGRLAAALFLAVLLITFFLFGLAGAQAQNASSGALIGIWSAIVAMLVLWVLAWITNYILMDRLEQILSSDYEYLHGNTLRDLPSYTVWNTLSAAFSHALLFPIFGAVFGSIGGAIASRTSRRRQRFPSESISP